MVLIELVCEGCGGKFTRRKSDHKYGRSFCGRDCWLHVHNNPERNAKVSRDTAKKRGDVLRDRGYKDTYRKVDGVHEHVTIMEKKLGRKLFNGEVVHHKDHDKRNNDPNNLEVKTRADHIREHAISDYRIPEPIFKECHRCNVEFELNVYQRSRYRYGQLDFYCSRTCYMERMNPL